MSKRIAKAAALVSLAAAASVIPLAGTASANGYSHRGGGKHCGCQMKHHQSYSYSYSYSYGPSNVVILFD